MAEKFQYMSSKTKRIISDPRHCKALGAHLLSLDCEKKCHYDNQNVKQIHEGMTIITEALVNGVKEEDPRFEGKLFGTGSFYDELKVGVVDEFDFLLQMTLLSNQQDLMFFKSEPGFANIVVNNKYSCRWPETSYCPKHNIAESKSNTLQCKTSCETLDILDASAVQDKFRKVADKVLKKITLPDNWEHGGCMRPMFSGFRKHGPATLYQFVWSSLDKKEEIKVNMDLTLAIKIPTPTKYKPFQFDFLDRYSPTNPAVQLMEDLMTNKPGLSIIPLYSNFMIVTGKGDKKYAWKVSCSQMEQQFLKEFDEYSLLKTLIRVMKILRDEYLTYYRRKTQRSRKKTKRRNRGKTEDVNPSCGIKNQDDGGTAVRPKKGSNLQTSVNGNSESSVEQLGELSSCSDDSDAVNESTTDLTEVDDLTPEEYSKRDERLLYQLFDIGLERVTPEPGSGEYWGPRQYVASVEFKVVALAFLLEDEECFGDMKRPATPENLACFVLRCLDYFHHIYESGGSIKSLYFQGPVCSPLNPDKLHIVLERLEKIKDYFIEKIEEISNEQSLDKIEL